MYDHSLVVYTTVKKLVRTPKSNFIVRDSSDVFVRKLLGVSYVWLYTGMGSFMNV